MSEQRKLSEGLMRLIATAGPKHRIIQERCADVSVLVLDSLRADALALEQRCERLEAERDVAKDECRFWQRQYTYVAGEVEFRRNLAALTEEEK